MKNSLTRIFTGGVLSVALLAPLALAPRTLWAQEDHRNNRKYHDARNNEDHEWNDHEDRAYRMWAKENHHKYREFSKLKRHDQEAYWDWRRNHSDAILKIDIR